MIDPKLKTLLLGIRAGLMAVVCAIEDYLGIVRPSRAERHNERNIDRTGPPHD